jgi:hypothetical protein
MTILATAGIVAGALAPLAAATTWLLVTDPALAAQVAATDSLAPVAEALARVLGRALVGLLAYL